MTGPITRPLLVIDGDNFAHRSYHALPKSIRRKGNRGGGAIVGFSNFLLTLYAGEQPRAVLVGWDTLGAPTYRQELFPAYQGGRQFDDEIVEQLDVLPELVAACGFANAKAAGYEADDFLAAAVAMEAGEMARIGPAEVRERYGVEPRQVPDFIALRGDPSDRLPGAKGVGPKGAAALLRKFATLEEAFAAGNLGGQAEQLRLYRRIAVMDASAPLPPIVDQAPTWETGAALARDWELNRLAQR